MSAECLYGVWGVSGWPQSDLVYCKGGGDIITRVKSSSTDM